MVIPEYYRTRSDGVELMRSYSDENYKLRQVETDIIYGSSVIDVIAGYNEGIPYSRYTYVETDEKDEPIE